MTGHAAASAIVEASRELSRALARLRFHDPVTHVYDPLSYARATFEDYVTRYARRGVSTLLVGMNPGPFGMAQTGVPFGEVTLVREWLRIDGPVAKPEREHPRRPVLGFACTRSEVSGTRLWGWARSRFETPEHFFDRFFVANYCPLLFLEESGRNRTPDKLAATARSPLFAACDRALVRIVEALEPQRVVGVGRFAEERAREALRGRGIDIARVAHPSPASPVANRGWERVADGALLAHRAAS